MVTSEEYHHVPTGTLALLAQQFGQVFASSSTWYRLVRIYKWRRPRGRIHPAKPKFEIRTSHPNEIWHVDITMIRLLDGTRAYLQAVPPKYSIRVHSQQLTLFKTFGARGYYRQFSRLAMVRRWVS